MLALSEERKGTLFQDTNCFNEVMNAWCKSGGEAAADSAERILNLAESRGLQPSEAMYATLMNAFAESGLVDGPERAEAILARMKSDFESGKNPHCKPKSISIATLFKCWQRSGREDAAACGHRDGTVIDRRCWVLSVSWCTQHARRSHW